jgi:putative aldouronate transport system permease protein
MKLISKRKYLLRYTRSDIVFLTFDWVLMSIFLILLVYPLAYIVMSSFSAGRAYMNLSLIPSKYSLEGYKAVFEHPGISSGYLNSVIYTVSYTLISLAVTICCAYPLSRKDFGGRKPILILCLFTMYFSGGLIPTYIWIRQLNLIDSIWALLLPPALSIYNMIVMRTYFSTQIPDELQEASKLDGCSDIRFLLQIVLPLSLPIIAVITLYYAVYMWNEYFYPMIYLTSREKRPLPNVLREILMVNTQHALSNTNLNAEDMESMSRLEERAELMKYSLIIVASVPVMILYPFIQKYFVKGIMIGAIKG